MPVGLGIDTGGTYTDAILYDFATGQVIESAKSLTIKEDLLLGIRETLCRLTSEKLLEVSLVSLSTTLATNACVEGKGSRAQLILAGCDREVVVRYGHEYGLPSTDDIYFIDGGHNQQGSLVREPDWDRLLAYARECAPYTDAYAVVELWGVRNPALEQQTARLVTEATGLPVVCGHDITSELNSLRRAASALLNAQLIPVINEFLNAVRRNMADFHLTAPLVIVRGDGTLMAESFARSHPVETLFSGPAASVAGGMRLAGEKECIILDMGGTTTDMAVVSGGMPQLEARGARVGKWRTGIRSIRINTVGLGGDSLIRPHPDRMLKIGPVRAAPLSWLAGRWPRIRDAASRLLQEGKRHTLSLCEFFYRLRDIEGDPYYSGEEQAICAALEQGPLSLEELAVSIGSSIYELRTSRLERYGIVLRSGLTPTDLMHLAGDFVAWDTEAARLGAQIMALQLDIPVESLTSMVYDKIREHLFQHLVQLLVEQESLLPEEASAWSEQMASFSYRNKMPSLLHIRYTTPAVLVGLGAPVHLFLPDVARALGTRCVIPPYAEVANAVGAITGSVVAEIPVLIKPVYSAAGITGYTAHAPSSREYFPTYAAAVTWAREQAIRAAEETALARGAGAVQVQVHVQDREAILPPVYRTGSPARGENQTLLETLVIAVAAGKVLWQDAQENVIVLSPAAS